MRRPYEFAESVSECHSEEPKATRNLLFPGKSAKPEAQNSVAP